MSATRALAAVLLATLLTLPAASALAQAEDHAKEDATFLDGPVYPYVPQTERGRFFRAAGKDNELSAEEFAAAAKKKDGFPRAFDSWKAILAFDRNGNGSIDWFEADAYRRDLRKRVLAACDADKDGRLTGKEIAAAADALRKGTLPSGTDAQAARAKLDISQPLPNEKGLLKTYDTDGDGKLSADERRTARADVVKQRQAALMDAYDADGDGTLDRDERRQIWRDRRKTMRAMEKEWELGLFDEDGDGELSEEEEAQKKELGRKFRKLGKQIELALFDDDGDGEVSKLERLSVMKDPQFMTAVMRIRKRFETASDYDGDGTVVMVERLDFQMRSQKQMAAYVEKFLTPYDTNGDERLSNAERAKAWEGVKKEFATRMTRADGNSDGKLTVAEAERMITGFMEDTGVLPKAEQQEGG